MEEKMNIPAAQRVNSPIAIRHNMNNNFRSQKIAEQQIDSTKSDNYVTGHPYIYAMSYLGYLVTKVGYTTQNPISRAIQLGFDVNNKYFRIICYKVPFTSRKELLEKKIHNIINNKYGNSLEAYDTKRFGFITDPLSFILRNGKTEVFSCNINQAAWCMMQGVKN